MSDSVNSGIFVLEGPAGGQPIPTRRETVTAFIGPAPRGPVNIPVAVRSVGDYLARFGSPHRRSRLEFLLKDYFDNGGSVAVVVRVCRSERRHTIGLPAGSGTLMLEALNPGPLEFLRASVDYDRIDQKQRDRFNLVIHRLESPRRPLVVEQEIYPSLSVDPADPDWIGHALIRSELVRLKGDAPPERPERTLGPGVEAESAYVYTKSSWADPDAPTDYDLIGSDDEGTGLFALEQVASVDVVCLLPGLAGRDLGPVALFAAERYCRERNAVFLIDPPSHWTSVDDVDAYRQQHGLCSPNVATYFPRLATAPGHLHPPSALGGIAGSLAAEDARHGSGGLGGEAALKLNFRHKPARHLGPHECGHLRRLGVNSLVTSAPGWLRLEGLVTLARGQGLPAEWNDMRMRRTTLFVISSLIRGTRWAAYQRNKPETRRETAEQVREFLAGLHANGGLVGSSPVQAFFVRCDRQLNREHEDRSGQMEFMIGIALRQAGQFLCFRFEQDRFGCQVHNLGVRDAFALTG